MSLWFEVIISLIGFGGVAMIARYIHFEGRRIQRVEDRLGWLEKDRSSFSSTLKDITKAMQKLSSQSESNGQKIAALDAKIDRGEESHESIRQGLAELTERIAKNETIVEERTEKNPARRLAAAR